MCFELRNKPEFAKLLYILTNFFVVPSHCNKGTPEKEQVLAFKGWPYRVDCTSVFYIRDYNIYDWFDDHNEPTVKVCEWYRINYFYWSVDANICENIIKYNYKQQYQ